MEEAMRRRIAELSQAAPGSIGDMLQFSLLSCDPEKGQYILSCRTLPWMQNPAGTLHGGMCATVLDQAMGIVAYCLKPGKGISPSIQLNIQYHRPMIPGEEILVRVHAVSVTRTLISLTAEATRPQSQDKVFFSGSGTYFYKPAVQ